MALTIITFRADDAAHMAAARHIRDLVFCHEQGISPADEWDGKDGVCDHYLVIDGDQFLATARVRPYDGGTFKIERMAVTQGHRGRGIGKLLMRDILARMGKAPLILNAQTNVEAFYRQLGFVRAGDVFMEAGIPHIRMTR